MTRHQFFTFIFSYALPFFIVLAISFPFIGFFLRVGLIEFPEDSKLISYIYFTILQSILSVGLSFIIALPGALGLIYFYNKPYYSFLEWIYWLPLFFSPIVISGSLINILETVGIAPFGLFPIVLAHALIYSGGLSVILSRFILSKAFHHLEWALVHGVSRWRFLWGLIRGVLKKDIQLGLITIFGFCVTSFSIPILLGGFSYQTLEVVIYKYLKVSQNWPIALGLLFLEIIFLFALSFFIFKPASHLKNLKSVPIGLKYCVLFGIIPTLVMFLGCLEGLFYIPEVLKLPRFLEALLTTLFISLTVGFGIILSFILISFCYSSVFLKKFLIGYMAPSVVLTGFAFLIFMPDYVYLSWVLGLIILFLPALYRWAGESLLSSLDQQIQVAQTLGASFYDIFKYIIWPQSQQLFFILGGIASFWASGDFAYTMITSQGETHLALIAQQLLGRYRVEQGLSMIWILLFTGSICFSVFIISSRYLSFLKKKDKYDIR